MLILGLSGGPSLSYENLLDFKFNMFHDAAAALIKDGEVLIAIEEERLNRIKHTNKAPVLAIRACLEKYDLKLSDIDKFAIYFDYNTFKNLSSNVQKNHMDDYRDYVNRYLYSEFREEVEKDKFFFVPHHYAHAESAFWESGFSDALTVVFDGAGDNSAGMIFSYRKGEMQLLYEFPISDSLGLFYLDITKMLGYNLFDEYKVMGLASYGDPTKYRKLFKKFYALLPDGKFIIKHIHKQLLHKVIFGKLREEPFSQKHKDIAASLQETLETIVLHVLRYYQGKTGHKNLCMAGGVAHNCKSNGHILYSNIFESVFVQPASHDAGCAVGAALYMSEHKKSVSLKHVYWGQDVGNDNYIEKSLKQWYPFITWKRMNNKSRVVASLLSKGSIIGWVQGCSEFGPRALGNRSILADPRPNENKDIINSMVKKREAYRPFAPAIMEEYLSDYFDCPDTKSDFSFMTYAIDVKEDLRDKLGAITHVDGTARVQTVSKENNLAFWGLLEAFYSITGVPILLNTSFNNFAEPIVDSIDDAIICYLTTGLHCLVIGNFLITRNNVSDDDLQSMKISIPKHVQILQISKYISKKQFTNEYLIRPNYNDLYTESISQNAFSLLGSIGGRELRVKDLLQRYTTDKTDIWNEIKSLWEKRLINLRP